MSRKEIRQGIKNVMRDFRMGVARNPIRWNGENALLGGKQVMTRQRFRGATEVRPLFFGMLANGA
jgi:hypothetical protein